MFSSRRKYIHECVRELGLINKANVFYNTVGAYLILNSEKYNLANRRENLRVFELFLESDWTDKYGSIFAEMKNTLAETQSSDYFVGEWRFEFKDFTLVGIYFYVGPDREMSIVARLLLAPI